VGVDKAKASQVAGTEPEETQIRYENTAAVADENVGNQTAPVDEKTQLASGLPGQRRKAPGRFRRYDLLGAGLATAETLDPLELTRLKAGGFSLDLRYGFLLE